MSYGQLVRANLGLTRKWQVLKKPIDPTPGDTLITTFNRPANLETVAAHIVGALRIRSKFFGTNANNQTITTLQLSGWYVDGPGNLIATMALTLGNHQPNTAFPDSCSFHVQQAFDPSLTWFEVDTYGAPAGPESGDVTVVNNTDGPSFFDYDNSKSMYEWILAEINGGTAVLCGGIWIPNG